MQRTMVRYKLKPGMAETNENFIRAVFKKLNATAPEGLRYVSFKLDDGLSFVHIASVETGDGNNPLTALDEFKAFTKDIADRCDEKPVATPLTEIGSYNVF